MDLKVIGSLGVIVKAKQRELISEARPVIERLRRAGLYLHDRVIAVALEQAEER